jgi:hypothetical protein
MEKRYQGNKPNVIQTYDGGFSDERNHIISYTRSFVKKKKKKKKNLKNLLEISSQC